MLSKQQFQDGLRLRYNIPLEGVSLECACGKPNSIDHALICKLGGYTHLRHNHLRDTLSNLLDVVCKDVVKEPHLLPIKNEDLPRGTSLKQDARLDNTYGSEGVPKEQGGPNIRTGSESHELLYSISFLLMSFLYEMVIQKCYLLMITDI